MAPTVKKRFPPPAIGSGDDLDTAKKVCSSLPPHFILLPLLFVRSENHFSSRIIHGHRDREELIIVLRRQEALKHTYTTAARAATTFFAQNVVLLIPPLLPPPREGVVGLPTAQTPLLLSWGESKGQDTPPPTLNSLLWMPPPWSCFWGESSKQFLLSFSAFLAKFVCVCRDVYDRR